MKILKEEFARRVNPDDTYTLNDLKKILSEVYKEVTTAQKEEGKKKREKRERDENGEIIKKRPASAYNLFIKEQSAIIKAANPTLDSKAVFKMAIDEWKKKKEQVEQVEEEPKQVDDKPASNPAPEPHSQHQSEPQPQSDEKNDTNITVEPEPQPEPQPEEKKTKKARKPKKTTEMTDDE